MLDDNSNNLSVVGASHEHLTAKKVDYFLSFFVIFKELNTFDFLRVFGNDEIISEIMCDSKIKIIHVPLKFQNNIKFEMFSKQNNECKFYLVSMSREIEKNYRSKCFCFLFTKTDWLENTFYKDLAYAGNMFGHQLDGKIARPDKHKIEFKANLHPIDSPHNEKIWIDYVTGKQYVLVVGNWIAKFRPGYACLYRKSKKQIHHISPHLNIFNHVEFIIKKNLVQLTKSTGKNLNLPVDHLIRFKKIETEEQYLDFLHDSLIFYPAIVYNWFDFKL